MGCYQCGSPGGDESRLCPECTQARIQGRAASDARASAPRAPARSGDFRVIGLLLALAGLAAAGVLIWIGVSGHAIGAPTISEVEGPVRARFLARPCDGKLSLDELKVGRVGGFDAAVGGYAVYGSFAVSCKSGHTTTTHHSEERGNTPIAYVRRTTTGKIETFVPPMLQAGMDVFKAQIDQLNAKMKADLERSMKKGK